MKDGKIRVLIIDDSAVVRKALSDILSSDPELSVMGTAADPYEAARLIANEVPDVITLDVEMPRMDGLTFLRKLMEQHPVPVVMCSSLTSAGSESALKAMEMGAVEVIEKPRIGTREFIEESKIRLCDAVRSASKAKLTRMVPSRRDRTPRPKLTADVILPPGGAGDGAVRTEKVVVIGASTGGTDALDEFLRAMPPQCPPILIVQHLPANFTGFFARRLAMRCCIRVEEACNNQILTPGCALIAPGDRHALLRRIGTHYQVELRDGPFVCRHRPSVNVLFRSAARYGGANVVGVLMTGMGDDGAAGMLELRQSGAFTIAQDESSCVVFGMPAEAIRLGGASAVLPLDQIADEVIRRCIHN